MYKIVINIFVCFFCVNAFAQKLPKVYLDLINGKENKEQIFLLDSVSSSLRSSEPQQALVVARYNLYLSNLYQLPKARIKVLLSISRTYRSNGIYDSALIYIDSAKQFAFANSIKEQYGNIYDYEGIVYTRKGDYENATKSLYKSISYSEQIHDSTKIHDALDHLGTVSFYRSDFKTAISFYKKGLKYISKKKSIRSYISTIDNIGLCFSNLKMLDSALYYQTQTINELETIQDSAFMAEAYINIASTLLELKNYIIAKPYIEKAYIINNNLKNQYGVLMGNLYLGRLLEETKKYSEAIKYLQTAYDIAKKLEIPNQIKQTSSSLADVYEKTGDYKKSTFYMRELVNVMQDLYTEENTKAINELSAKYETEKKHQEIELLTKDKAIKEQKIKNDKYIKLSIAVVAILLLILLISYFNRFRKKKKDNIILQEKNDAIAKQNTKIEEQKFELEIKNKEITDSINYAKRIQASVIPSQNLLNSLLKEYFIYFQPKDIVSGDFYWTMKHNGIVYVVVADCTGHGVPGAMMSMLGTSLLNQIIPELNTLVIGDILKEMHTKLVKSLNENVEHRNSKDGMDLSLIAIDERTKNIYFSGAGRPLYYVKNNEFHIIKADKYSIGSVFESSVVNFTTHQINYNTPVLLYMFTDGVPDQFGGPYGKKFMTKQLQEVIKNNCNTPFNNQQSVFSTAINNWKSGHDQTDDITFVGIRLS
jgi:serine phosphatase RsbU (regulator of sigma subunit)